MPSYLIPRVGSGMAIFIYLVIGTAWILGIVPTLINSAVFTNLHPILQYTVYNVGFVLLLGATAGFIIAVFLGHKVGFLSLLINGLASFLFFSFVLDMYQPPFAVDPSGKFVIPVQGTLVGTSVDYMTATIWAQAGISGPFLFIATYGITPIIAILIAVVLLGGNKFLSRLAEGL